MKDPGVERLPEREDVLRMRQSTHSTVNGPAVSVVRIYSDDSWCRYCDVFVTPLQRCGNVVYMSPLPKSICCVVRPTLHVTRVL